MRHILIESGHFVAELDRRQLVSGGFICLVCGFEIDSSQKYLARHFVPPIPADTAAAFLKDIGVK